VEKLLFKNLWFDQTNLVKYKYCYSPQGQESIFGRSYEVDRWCFFKIFTGNGYVGNIKSEGKGGY